MSAKRSAAHASFDVSPVRGTHLGVDLAKEERKQQFNALCRSLETERYSSVIWPDIYAKWG